jgi:hypothetical protein
MDSSLLKMRYINSLLPIFPEISENLGRDILDLTLFGELVDKTEETISGFRGYQVFVQRFLSPLTPYRELLIKHSMGSGKTCTAFLIILAYHQKQGQTKNTIVFAGNHSQIKNINSLLKKCIGYLSVETYEAKQLENYIKNKVEFLTFDSVNKLTAKDLLKGKQVIIVDEAHTIHHKTAAGDQYNNMMKLFDEARLKNVRLILMTGTPITNHYSKLFQLMDLLLPEGMRFHEYEMEKLGQSCDIGDDDDFEKEKSVNRLYFDKDGKLLPTAIDEISKRLYGRVSSFQIVNRITRVIEMGEYYNFNTRRGTDVRSKDTSRSKVYIDEMIGIQRKSYIKLLNQNQSSEDSEISLTLFTPQIKDKKDYKIVENQTITILNPTIRDQISNADTLKHHSILYYNILKELGDIGNSDENVKKEAAFYFNDLIKGEANQLFSAILELHGYVQLVKYQDITTLYSKLNDPHQVAVPKKRFAVISSNFGTVKDNEIEKIINIFSHSSNKYGEHLRLIIGSRKIAVGYNLINGRQVHIVLQWNSPMMNQAIARVIRGKTNFTNDDENYVKIYKHFVTPGDLTKDQKETLFERKLRRVEEKEDKNSKILHLVDRVAVDCYVNRKYHISNRELDFTSDCNFLECTVNYDCGKDVRITRKTDNTFLFSTDNTKLNRLIDQVAKHCKKNTISIPISSLFHGCCSDFTRNEFYFYLLEIILGQTIFEDALGFYKILGYTNDVIFFKNKPFIDSENDMLSYITLPQSFAYEYDPVDIDKFFICDKEKSIVKDIITSTDEVFILETYLDLNILTKVWVFEMLFPDSPDSPSKKVIFSTESDNFIRDPVSEIGIRMVHKILSEFHLKEHKIKKPEDIVKGLRIFINEWKNPNIPQSTALNLANLLIKSKPKPKEVPEIVAGKETSEYPSNIEYILVREKDSIKRKKKGDMTQKGRNCYTITRDELYQFQLEPYLKVIEENYPTYQTKLNLFFKKFNIKFNKKDDIIETLRKACKNAKRTTDACEFLYELQQNLFTS